MTTEPTPTVRQRAKRMSPAPPESFHARPVDGPGTGHEANGHSVQPPNQIARVGPQPETLRWWVIHTKSRQEKALDEDLRAYRVECYLPLVRAVRYYGKRKSRVELPLFPGYLFLRGTLDQTYRAERTERVAKVIKVSDQERFERELTSLRSVLQKNGRLESCNPLKVGSPVEVVSGPFKGVIGLIDHQIGGDRLVLHISAIGKAVLLEIDRSLLRATGT